MEFNKDKRTFVGKNFGINHLRQGTGKVNQTGQSGIKHRSTRSSVNHQTRPDSIQHRRGTFGK